MAQPSPAPFSTYDAIGNREDLSDAIYDISPTATPFMSRASRGTAEATLHEWQTDALASASSSNAVIEGDEATTDVGTATTRLTNYTQISDKVPRTTGTQEAVRKAGRRSEMAYQISKRSRELKTDMESALLANNAKAAGSDTVARVLAGVPSWIATNEDVGSGGSAPTGDGTDTRTDGTQKAFTEIRLKNVLQQCWDEGGDPDVVMTGSFNKQVMSTFGGNATREINAQDRSLVAAISLYESDFGSLEVIPNRFQRSRDVLVLQMDMWSVSYLRPFRLSDLAKTGDTDRKQLLVEYTVQARNEKASGIVADCTTAT